MKKINIIITALLIITALNACKKNVDADQPITPTPIPNPNPTTEIVKDIYVGGFENETWTNAPANSPFLGSYAKANARVWKNGVQMPLTGSPFSSGVNDVAVLGNDVYAVGTFDTAAYNPLNQIMVKPTIWKNGVPTFLSAPGKGGGCRRIEISGNDIYVAGYEYGISSTGTGIVWKNGVVIYSEPNTSINDIKVVGNDLYMVLRQGIGSGAAGSLWKNGVYTNISSTPNTAYPTGLAVVGTDVYICGFKSGGQFFKAMLWKNGVETELTNGDVEAAAYAVTVNNGAVYVAGRRKKNLIPGNPNNPLLYTGVVWKNGNELSTYNYYPTGVIDGMENTGWLGIEFVAGTEYLVGFSDRTLNIATGYYISTAFTSRAGGTANFPFTLTNMAVTAGTQYGGVKANSMFITKQ